MQIKKFSVYEEDGKYWMVRKSNIHFFTKGCKIVSYRNLPCCEGIGKIKYLFMCLLGKGITVDSIKKTYDISEFRYPWGEAYSTEQDKLKSEGKEVD